MGEDLAGILAIVVIFGWPGILIGLHMIRSTLNEKGKRKERAEARRIYERLMHRKLDVVESALAMGFTRDEVAELDRRLERSIGAERMASLLNKEGTVPLVSRDLSDSQLAAEIAAIRQQNHERA